MIVVVGAQHGVFYIVDDGGDEPRLALLASYAYRNRRHVANVFKLGAPRPEGENALA